MDLPLLIRKLKEDSRYADMAWKDTREYPFLDLSLHLEQAAEWLTAFQKNVGLKAALYAATNR